MMRFIPITYNTITNNKLHWYYFSNYMRFNTTNQYCSFSKENKSILIVTYFGENAAANTYNTLKISRQAWTAAGGNTYTSPYKIIDEPTMRPWGAKNMRFCDPDGNFVVFRSFPKKTWRTVVMFRMV